MPRPITVKATYDQAIAKRLAEMRTKQIHKNQGEAEKMLGMSRGSLSTLERGKGLITLKSLERLKPYKINPYYILSGELPKVLGEVEKTNTIIDVKAMNERLDKVEHQNVIITGTLEKMWHIINRHEKTIDALQGEIEALKRG